jgi:dephospho-CoA kinase
MTNLVVVVEAALETRVHRLEEFRGVAREDALARISAQATDEQRRAVADVLLDNSGAPEELAPQVSALWDERLVPFEHNLRTRTLPPGGAVELVAPDPAWPAQAQRLIARLALACGAAALRIDHIGSTSVPGLPAKDVIDIQITVADLETADGLRDALENAGFPRGPHRTDDPKAGTDPALWAKRIHGNADPARRANVHVRVQDWPGQRFALSFRDWLRAEPAAREEYLAIKRKAEASAAGLTGEPAIEAYLDVKTPWFDEVYPRVLAWAGQAG